ncbi:MAG: hypothetical protein WAT16_03835 [Saprospiraceae bacterium]
MKLNKILFLIIGSIYILSSCKKDPIDINIDPVDPIDTTTSQPKIVCYIGKYEKPDINFTKHDTTSGIAIGYKNCYNFRANVTATLKDTNNKIGDIDLFTYFNKNKNISYLRETYTFNNIPFIVGYYPLNIQKIPSFRNEDDYVWAAYQLDTSKNNYLKITSIDNTSRIIKGQFSAQYYFEILYSPGEIRTEPDTVRLQQVNFWAKY